MSGVPWLYAIDVEVDNITAVNSDSELLYHGPLSAVYRRVMDWDVEPTAFSEYVTIGADGATTGEPNTFIWRYRLASRVHSP